MQLPIAVGVVLAVLVVLVRHFAAHRVANRQGRFVWLVFLPTLSGGGVILWAGTLVFASVPLVGLLLVISGAIYLALQVRMLTRMSRSITSATSEDDVATAMTDPMADYMLSVVGLYLIGGLVAVVVVIIWGLSQSSR